MIMGDTRKMVIIKNIPSNVVEEAILILKKENSANTYCKPDENYIGTCSANEYILKEAERIINNYERECKRKAKLKYSQQNMLNKTIGRVINFLIVGSIILLVFALYRTF